MANKNKSKGNKKKGQKYNSKANRENEQPKPKVTLPCIENAQDLENLLLPDLISLSLANQYRTEIEQLCTKYTSVALYGSEKDLTEDERKDEETNNKKKMLEGNSEMQNDEEGELIERKSTSLRLVVNAIDVDREKKAVAYCQAVTSMFANIKLLIIYYHPRLNSLLPLLLNNWKKYEVLNTIMMIGGSRTDHFITQFWVALRSVKSLNNLTWSNVPLIAPAIKNQSGMLGQMEYICINHYNGDLIPLFRQFGAKLKFLRIKNSKEMTVNCDELEQVFKSLPQCCINLEKVYLGVKFDCPERALELFCDRFRNLNSFYVFGMHQSSIHFVLAQISKLPDIDEFNIDSPVCLFTEEDAASYEPFPSVRVISFGLTLSSTYTAEQFSNTIGRLFPNLEIINMACFYPKLANALRTEAARLFPNMKKANIQLLNERAIKEKWEGRPNRRASLVFDDKDYREIYDVDDDYDDVIGDNTDEEEDEEGGEEEEDKENYSKNN